MWSDRTPSPSLGPQLRAAVASRATLKSLMWLASGPQGPCLLEDALATIAYAHGHAVITTATTRLELRVSAFDLLEAAMVGRRQHVAIDRHRDDLFLRLADQLARRQIGRAHV